jgi:dephospho-CoA kinase
MSGTGKSTLVQELRRRGLVAYDADLRVLLTAPEALLVSRLCARTGNAYGRTNAELVQVLSDRAEVEPVLRRAADLVLTSTAPPAELADAILARIADLGREHSD